MSCNLSEYVWERGYQKGLKMWGLVPLVRSLNQIYGDFARVYEAVVRNPEYETVTAEEIRMIYEMIQ